MSEEITVKPIAFGSPTVAPYGALSNLSPDAFELSGVKWPSVEHYYQAMKFVNTEHVDQIRFAPSPAAAGRMGRDPKRPLRADWDQVREEIMREALLAKFSQNPTIRKVLRETGEAELQHADLEDEYWGTGLEGKGQNRLGAILMEMRAEFNA